MEKEKKKSLPFKVIFQGYFIQIFFFQVFLSKLLKSWKKKIDIDFYNLVFLLTAHYILCCFFWEKKHKIGTILII